jgi:hypothetical protein
MMEWESPGDDIIAIPSDGVHAVLEDDLALAVEVRPIVRG